MSDVVRMEFGKALGAIAALQQKGLTRRDRGKALLEAPGLAGKNQRRKPVQRFLDAGERRLVGITRNLPDRQTAPAVGRPRSGHLTIPPRDFSHLRATLVMHHLRGGSRFAIGDIRISESMKHESRLGGAALEKRVSAILGHRHVPAVAKSRNAATVGPCCIHSRTLAATRAQGKHLVQTCRGRHFATTNGRIARAKSFSVDRCSTSAITSSAQRAVSWIAKL